MKVTKKYCENDPEDILKIKKIYKLQTTAYESIAGKLANKLKLC